MPSVISGQSTITRRYANAFLSFAEEKGTLETLFAELSALSSLITENNDLARVVANPLISRSAIADVMAEVCKKSGFGQDVINFVAVVGENRRLPLLSGIVQAVSDEMANRRREVTAQVVTAHKLGAAQSKELIKTLSKQLDMTVTLEQSVDPEILGGMVVRVGSRMIDDSVRTRLGRLKRQMTGQSNSTQIRQEAG